MVVLGGMWVVVGFLFGSVPIMLGGGFLITSGLITVGFVPHSEASMAKTADDLEDNDK